MARKPKTIALADLQTMVPKRKERDGPTPEQMTKGGHQDRFVTHVETFTRAKAFVSDHDPVERWRRSGKLSPSQMAAIQHVQRLWRLTEQVRSITASYGERTGGSGDAEKRALNEIEAREDLHRVMDYFTGLSAWWNVFEAVCRHGMSAGTAGDALGFGTRSSDVRAHTTVCFVADKIAEQERL